MIHVILNRTDPDGHWEFRSRSFEDLGDLARFLAAGGRGSWDSAEVVGPGTRTTRYIAAALRPLVAGD